jgi:hypothetical protein
MVMVLCVYYGLGNKLPAASTAGRPPPRSQVGLKLAERLGNGGRGTALHYLLGHAEATG